MKAGLPTKRNHGFSLPRPVERVAERRPIPRGNVRPRSAVAPAGDPFVNGAADAIAGGGKARPPAAVAEGDGDGFRRFKSRRLQAVA